MLRRSSLELIVTGAKPRSERILGTTADRAVCDADVLRLQERYQTAGALPGGAYRSGSFRALLSTLGRPFSRATRSSMRTPPQPGM